MYRIAIDLYIFNDLDSKDSLWAYRFRSRVDTNYSRRLKSPSKRKLVVGVPARHGPGMGLTIWAPGHFARLVLCH